MKTTKKKIEVMQAYADGKKIECKSPGICWREWILPQEPFWNWSECDYRIKEEVKYRPYKDTEEMINDFCNRFNVKRTSFGEPFIWVKDEDEEKRLITGINKYNVISDSYFFDLKEIFEKYTYLDGSPCGINE